MTVRYVSRITREDRAAAMLSSYVAGALHWDRLDDVTAAIEQCSPWPPPRGYSAALVVDVCDDEIENDEGWIGTLVNLEIDLADEAEAERFVAEHQSLLGARLERPDRGTFVHCSVINHPGLIDELERELNGGASVKVEIDDAMWSPPERIAQ